MKLSQNYALAMFNGRKRMDAEIIESVFSLGLLVTILYEMLQLEMLKLENSYVLLGKNYRQAEGAKEKIVAQMETRGETLTIEEWIKHLFFSVDSICMKVIVSETEKQMISGDILNLVQRKLLFSKKMIYSCSEEAMATLHSEVAKLDTLEDFLLPYLLNKCGLLSYVVPKNEFKSIKHAINASEFLNNEFVKKISATISSVSSTLATASIMM